MENGFRNNLQKIFESFSLRNGYGTKQMPVIGADYKEEPIKDVYKNEDEQNTEKVLNILNDLLVKVQGNIEAQNLISQAKNILTGNVSPVVGQPQEPENPEEINEQACPNQLPIEQPTIPISVDNEPQEYNERNDTQSEIASLLVTIGHILHSDRLIPNKFDIPFILKYLNQTFANQSPENIQSLYESLQEGKFGKALSGLGIAAASLASSQSAPAAEKHMPTTEPIRQETVVDANLDTQTSIQIRVGANKLSKTLVQGSREQSMLANRLSVLGAGVASKKISVEDATNNILKAVPSLESQRNNIIKYFRSI